MAQRTIGNHSHLAKRALAVIGIKPESLQLGDITAATLDAVGITKERVQEWWGDCDCDGRQERLNKLGNAIVGFIVPGFAEKPEPPQ